MTGETVPEPAGMSRRALLTGGAFGIGIGAVAGAVGTGLIGGTQLGTQQTGTDAAGAAAHAETTASAAEPLNLSGFGSEALPCHGVHQAGIATVAAAHIRYVSYNLRSATDRAALQRMFVILTDDIEGLTSGNAPLADPEPELAARPARLSITIAVGTELVNRVDAQKPPHWLAPLPAFSKDQLGQGFDGGDLLCIIQADDPLPLAHAARMLARDLAQFVTPHWSQQGFRQARGSEADGTTMRNLMGQIDGTVNVAASDEYFDNLLWLDTDAGWLAYGSALVLRRIRMELATWDELDRPGKEAAMGRRISDGSPLSLAADEGTEFSEVDFDATNQLGLKMIPAAAHIRRAHSADSAERIIRRSANFDEPGESGLIFGCYQRDPLKQFVPIQQRLDELDMMNEWITHTGSAVFAVLPGFEPNTLLGESLFA